MKIGDLEISSDRREVICDGAPLKMSSRAFDIFCLLAEANGEVVTIDRILSRVWPTTVVEESNIQVHICGMRRALGERRHVIQTELGKGYRLVVDKAEVASDLRTSNRERHALSPDARASALPSSKATFFGRNDEIDALFAALEENDSTVTTVVGAPGVGKSRLALEVARRLEQERGFQTFRVALAGTDDAEAKHRIADGLKACRFSVALRPMLLLDDCDHSIETVYEVIKDIELLDAGHAPVVLATCRSPLRAAMENVFYLDPLSAEPVEISGDRGPAVELFCNRLRALDPRVSFDKQSMTGVRAIIERLDGFPFAIEIAARHVALLGIESVLSLIDQNINLSLTKICRQYDERHESLHSAWGWTWNKLSPTDQRLLKRAAGLPSPLTFETLSESMAQHQESFHQCVESLSVLIEASFLQRSSADLPHGYTLPNTLRRFLGSLESFDEKEERKDEQAAGKSKGFKWPSGLTL
ncbi:winged helix-turn-helix domain-containing protein [Paraburkholderia strydomiana]|uniref:winged helix-turn-helix domain-containing protein n=1 Tax=Paraburkholderia strydomiana TaxID=1245417 RepID=UPI0038B951EF